MGDFRALAGVGFAVIVVVSAGCTVDRTGLGQLSAELGDADDNTDADDGRSTAIDAADARRGDDDGGAIDARDGSAVADAGIDRTPDSLPDRRPDLIPEVRVDSSTDTQPPIDAPVDRPVDVPAPSTCAPTCELGAVTVTSPGGRFAGKTDGASTSAGSCGGGAAPESVFRLVLTGASDLFVTTHGTGFDTVVYLRNACCGVELACNDNADGRRTSVLTQSALPAGTYDIFVDGAAASDAGAFTVDIFLSAPSSNPGESCGRPSRVANAALAGTTCGYRDDYKPRDGCQDSGDSSFDTVYYFVLDQPTTVEFNTCGSTCFDSVLYMRDVCTDTMTEQICDDDACAGCLASSGSQSRVSKTLAAGAHYVVVDTYPGTPCGAYSLTPTGVPP